MATWLPCASLQIDRNSPLMTQSARLSHIKSNCRAGNDFLYVDRCLRGKIVGIAHELGPEFERPGSGNVCHGRAGRPIHNLDRWSNATSLRRETLEAIRRASKAFRCAHT